MSPHCVPDDSGVMPMWVDAPARSSQAICCWLSLQSWSRLTGTDAWPCQLPQAGFHAILTEHA
jgi:hypothetical protein